MSEDDSLQVTYWDSTPTATEINGNAEGIKPICLFSSFFVFFFFFYLVFL